MIMITEKDASMCLLALREYRVQMIAMADDLRTKAQRSLIDGHHVLAETMEDAAMDRDKEAERAEKVIRTIQSTIDDRARGIEL